MATIIPVGMDATTGQLKIVSATDAIQSPAIIGLAATPILATGTAAGSGATASIVGTNLSGRIILNTGLSLLSTGKVMTMTFANGFSFPGGCVINFAAGDANFANVLTKIYAQTGTSSVDLFTALTLGISTTYTGYYTVTGW